MRLKIYNKCIQTRTKEVVIWIIWKMIFVWISNLSGNYWGKTQGSLIIRQFFSLIWKHTELCPLHQGKHRAQCELLQFTPFWVTARLVSGQRKLIMITGFLNQPSISNQPSLAASQTCRRQHVETELAHHAPPEQIRGLHKCPHG